MNPNRPPLLHLHGDISVPMGGPSPCIPFAASSIRRSRSGFERYDGPRQTEPHPQQPPLGRTLRSHHSSPGSGMVPSSPGVFAGHWSTFESEHPTTIAAVRSPNSGGAAAHTRALPINEVDSHSESVIGRTVSMPAQAHAAALLHSYGSGGGARAPTTSSHQRNIRGSSIAVDVDLSSDESIEPATAAVYDAAIAAGGGSGALLVRSVTGVRRGGDTIGTVAAAADRHSSHDAAAVSADMAPAAVAPPRPRRLSHSEASHHRPSNGRLSSDHDTHLSGNRCSSDRKHHSRDDTHSSSSSGAVYSDEHPLLLLSATAADARARNPVTAISTVSDASHAPSQSSSVGTQRPITRGTAGSTATPGDSGSNFILSHGAERRIVPSSPSGSSAPSLSSDAAASASLITAVSCSDYARTATPPSTGYLDITKRASDTTTHAVGSSREKPTTSIAQVEDERNPTSYSQVEVQRHGASASYESSTTASTPSDSGGGLALISANSHSGSISGSGTKMSRGEPLFTDAVGAATSDGKLLNSSISSSAPLTSTTHGSSSGSGSGDRGSGSGGFRRLFGGSLQRALNGPLHHPSQQQHTDKAQVQQRRCCVCCRATSKFAPLLARLPALGYTATVLLGYGLSLFVNSITLVTSTPAQSIFLLAIGRALTLLIVIPILVLVFHLRPPSALLIHWDLAVPAFVAVAGNAAFLAYYALVAGGQVTVLAPMVGLYSVIPVTAGLVFRGEDRTWPKLTGIALSIVAVLVLGFSGGSGSFGSGDGATGGTIAMKVLYFLICWGVWGANDTLSSAVSLDPVTVAFSALVGQLLCCTLFGLIAFVEFTDSAAAVFGTGASGTSTAPIVFGWPHVQVMGANALAIVGWLAFVRLGQIGQVSAFVPVISLYTYIPVLLSVALLGESLNAMKIAGLLLAGAAVVLISISWAPKKKAPLSSAAPVSETTAVTTAPAVAEAEPSYAS